MLKEIRLNRKLQLILGLCAGIAFGFLIDKGGVTRYDVIMGQLLLTDFTVLKIMMTAVAVGMVGVYALRDAGLVNLYPRAGALGANVLGGLIFGAGFALLGYCPGTVVAASGTGALDAMLGGIPGTIIGAAIFAQLYPGLDRAVLRRGSFGQATLPELLRANHWVIIVPVCAIIVGLLWLLERAGL